MKHKNISLLQERYYILNGNNFLIQWNYINEVKLRYTLVTR